ncbi:MAG: tetratricopeptide repeat protein [Candidatus Eisenbacteria bacterium]|nr:tetratricopeptide repeat protein [Candidatus Eisenbacteria bacterium]
MSRRHKVLVVVLLLIAVGVRAVFFYQARSTAAPPGYQEFLYKAKAGEVAGAEGGSPSSLSSFYASYISLLARAIPDPQASQLVSHVLGVGLTLVTYLVGAEFHSSAAGLVAGLFVAASGSELFFEGKSLPFSLLSFLGGVLTLLLLKGRKTGRLAYFLFFGIFSSLAYLLWVNGWPLLLVGLVNVLFAVRAASRKRKAFALVLVVLGVLSLSLPLLVNNYHRYGELAVSSTGSGENFFLGNQKGLDGVPFTVRRMESATIGEQARWSSGLSLKEHRVSLFLYGQALGEIVKEPLSHLWLILKKVFFFLGPYEIPVNESLYFSLGREAPLIHYLLYLSVILMPLFVVGLITQAGKLKKADPVFFAFLSALIINGLFFTSSGERLFGLVSFSVVGSTVLVRAFGRNTLLRTRVFLLAGAVLAGAILFVLPQGIRKTGENPSRDNYLLGASYAMENRLSQAVSHFEKAISLDRTNIEARLGAASLLAHDGALEEAKTQYLRAVEIDSTEAFAYLGLGAIYQLGGDNIRTFTLCSKAVEKSPYLADAHNALGVSLSNLGYYQEAYDEFRKALFLRPGHRGAQDNITVLRRSGFELPEAGKSTSLGEMTAREIVGLAMEDTRKGDFAAARKKLEAAERKEPESLEVAYGFATLALQEGRLDDAISGYTKLLQRARANALVINNLASAYARKGQLKEAIKLWEQLLTMSPTNELARKNIEKAKEELRAREKTP